MQNNLLKQSESHRPALQFPWTGRSGRLQGSWLWLRHLLSCISTALCRLAEAAALAHATWQDLHPRELAKLSCTPARASSVPGCSSKALTMEIPQGEFSALQMQPGQTCSMTRATQGGQTAAESLTLKLFQNWHLFPLHTFCC